MEELEKRNITYSEYSDIINRLSNIEKNLGINGNCTNIDCDPNCNLSKLNNNLNDQINKIYTIKTILNELLNLLIIMCKDSDLNFITFKKLNSYLNNVEAIKSKIYNLY